MAVVNQLTHFITNLSSLFPATIWKAVKISAIC